MYSRELLGPSMTDSVNLLHNTAIRALFEIDICLVFIILNISGMHALM
jgi:hypothetical protein